MSDAMQSLKELLDKYKINYIAENNKITYVPDLPNGFKVEVEEDDGTITVYYEGWHEHFSKQADIEDIKKAIQYIFLCGLSEICRLKVFRRTGKDFKWIVEEADSGDWAVAGYLTTFNFNFWEKTEIRYLHNNVISASDIDIACPLNEIKYDLTYLKFLKCKECGKQVRTSRFDLDNGRIFCCNCSSQMDPDLVIKNSNVDSWYAILPQKKRDSFLSKLGFKQQPRKRTTKLLLGIGILLCLCFLIVSLVYPLAVTKKLEFLFFGICGLAALFLNYDKEKTPKWRKQKRR